MQFPADRSSSHELIKHCVNPKLFYFIVLAWHTFLVLSEELKLILIGHPASCCWNNVNNQVTKTTSADVVGWNWRQKRHSYSEFTFLAKYQHSFTRFYANCLFNNEVTNRGQRAEDTNLFFLEVLTETRRRYTNNLRTEQTGCQYWKFKKQMPV